MKKEELENKYDHWEYDSVDKTINLCDKKGKVLTSLIINDLVWNWIDQQDNDMELTDGN